MTYPWGIINNILTWHGWNQVSSPSCQTGGCMAWPSIYSHTYQANNCRTTGVGLLEITSGATGDKPRKIKWGWNGTLLQNVCLSVLLLDVLIATWLLWVMSWSLSEKHTYSHHMLVAILMSLVGVQQILTIFMHLWHVNGRQF